MSEHNGELDYQIYLTEKTPLEPVKLRVKVEYVKVEESSNFIAKAMIDGEVFYSPQGLTSFLWNGTRFESDTGRVVNVNGNYYRKVETEITWRDELKDYLATPSENGEVFFKFDVFNDGGHLTENEFIEMCHLVSLMNK
jgi:hypothetical protein